MQTSAQGIGVETAAHAARSTVAAAYGVPEALLGGVNDGPALQAAWRLFGRVAQPRVATILEAGLSTLISEHSQHRVRVTAEPLAAFEQFEAIQS